MIRISREIELPDSELIFRQVHASGPGGQHVNKVATGIHLRFDIMASSLSESLKNRLLTMNDQRISSRGIIVIKACAFKSPEKNRADAVERLARLIRAAGFTPKKRRPTRPGRAARERRLASKARRSRVKALRGKVID